MAYALDLRKRVIAAGRAKQQIIDQIVATLGVSASILDKWAKRWRERKQIAALPWAGGVKRKRQGCEAAIRAKVKEQPDITLAEWGKHLRTTAGEGLSARFFLFKPDLKNVCLPFSRQLEAVFHQERCQAVFIH